MYHMSLQAIKLSSITDGRNYVHRLQLVQRGDNVSDSQSSSVKSPVMQSFSAQPSSLPSMDDVSEVSSGSSSGGNNKISRKISLPVLNTSPPLIVESREVRYVCTYVFVLSVCMCVFNIMFADCVSKFFTNRFIFCGGQEKENICVQHSSSSIHPPNL